MLEESGKTAVHTLLLSPGIQLDVVDVDGLGEDDETARFPIPDMPQVGIVGSVETNDRGRRSAEQFDNFIQEIDEGLGQ